jgi:hypothetical protein
MRSQKSVCRAAGAIVKFCPNFSEDRCVTEAMHWILYGALTNEDAVKYSEIMASIFEGW